MLNDEGRDGYPLLTVSSCLLLFSDGHRLLNLGVRIKSKVFRKEAGCLKSADLDLHFGPSPHYLAAYTDKGFHLSEPHVSHQKIGVLTPMPTYCGKGKNIFYKAPRISEILNKFNYYFYNGDSWIKLYVMNYLKIK